MSAWMQMWCSYARDMLRCMTCRIRNMAPAKMTLFFTIPRLLITKDNNSGSGSIQFSNG